MDNAVWLYMSRECKTEEEMDRFVQWAASNRVKKVLVHIGDRQTSAENADYPRFSKLIGKCVQSGIEVHGMISALLMYTTNRNELPLQDRDCYCVDYHGISNWDEPVCGRGYLLDPTSEKTKAKVADTCRRILAAFPGISGIHLDFIRYFHCDSRLEIDTKNAGHWILMLRKGSPVKFEMEDGSKITYFIDDFNNKFSDPPIGDTLRLRRYYHYCFCQRCLDEFQKKQDVALPKELVSTHDKAKWILSNCPEKWEAFHGDCITGLVRYIREQTRAFKPGTQLSAAVWYNAPYGNELMNLPFEAESECRGFGQRWWQWVEEGLVDFLCPMDYWLLPESFRKVVAGQIERIKGKVPLYAGLLKSNEFEISEEQRKEYERIAMEAGADGICFFSYSTWKE